MSQKEPVQIVKSVFTQQVNEGWKREQLAEHYGISPADVSRALKQLGLKIRKFHKPKFILVDEEGTEVQEIAGEVQAKEKIEEVAAKEEVVEETTKRKRRTKAEIEADKKAQEAENQKEEVQEISSSNEKDVVSVADLEDSPIGNDAVVVEEQVQAEAKAEQEGSNSVAQDDNILKATEDVPVTANFNFDIPTGAGSEDVQTEKPKHDPVSDSAVAPENNPFLKAWGSNG